MPDDAPPMIRIHNARSHNLRGVDADIPRDRLTVITGLSGSGKSTLAFDTLYAEGRRKYVESLSVHARQYLEPMVRPDVDHIEGLPPTIAIGQHAATPNPRSTVATATELHDFWRLLFARLGRPHCPACGRPIARSTRAEIVDAVLAMPAETRVLMLAPLRRMQGEDTAALLARVLREGFVRVRIGGEVVDAKSPPAALLDTGNTLIEAVVDRLVVRPQAAARLAESIETALRAGHGVLTIASEARSPSTHPNRDGGTTAAPAAENDSGADSGTARTESPWTDRTFSDHYACSLCGTRLEELEPRLFSFNSPHGACAACGGLGAAPEFDAALVVPDPSLPLESAVEPWSRAGRGLSRGYRRMLSDFCTRFGVAPATPFRALPARVQRILLNGTTATDEKHYSSAFEGALPNLLRRLRETDSDAARHRLRGYMSDRDCPDCRGARLRPEALAVRIGDRSIDDLARMNVASAGEWFAALRFDGEAALIARPILDEVRTRLRFMNEVGVGYLTLNRAVATLSGGELQRIRLATQVGSGLVGVCYVLDEPTIGLHPRDNDRLIESLRRLRQAGNTVVVVEHDAAVIRAADWWIDVGPGAGAQGGRIVAQGPMADVLRSLDSATARYLRGELNLNRAASPRPVDPLRCLSIKGANRNNLKSIDVRIPLGVFCCVTGVSGSGKSTLVNQVLLRGLRRRMNPGAVRKPSAPVAVGPAEAGASAAHPPPSTARSNAPAESHIDGVELIDKVIEVDQSPLGRSQRGNAATYTGIFDAIRELFAKTREARVRGWSAARFSFNVKGGRCEACRGLGTRRIEMHFLPDVFVDCPHCGGTRYQRDTLEVTYRGRSIADVLTLRVDEALTFLESHEQLRALLQSLADVGLGYLTLGQTSATLSGGEAQRIKLAAELGRAAAGRTLYVLDEPTTGLHFADIGRLLDVLNRLCDLGHSVLVIEHNLDVIRQADWIIDLGPEGGDAGGQVVCAGTPKEVARQAVSHTGRYLELSQ